MHVWVLLNTARGLDIFSFLCFLSMESLFCWLIARTFIGSEFGFLSKRCERSGYFAFSIFLSMEVLFYWGIARKFVASTFGSLITARGVERHDEAC